MKHLYTVETVSTFRIKYFVQSEKEIKQTEMQRMIDENLVPEGDQQYLGEKITGVYATKENINEQLILDLDHPEEIMDDVP